MTTNGIEIDKKRKSPLFASHFPYNRVAESFQSFRQEGSRKTEINQSLYRAVIPSHLIQALFFAFIYLPDVILIL